MCHFRSLIRCRHFGFAGQLASRFLANFKRPRHGIDQFRVCSRRVCLEFEQFWQMWAGTPAHIGLDMVESGQTSPNLGRMPLDME